jgi:hypothetical protein
MVSGHLRERDGILYMVLSYTDEDGKRHTPCRSTHLPVKGNKKRAEAMLDQLRRDTEETLRCQKLAQEHSKGVEKKPIFFTAFMTDWLNMMKPACRSPPTPPTKRPSAPGSTPISTGTIQSCCSRR